MQKPLPWHTKLFYGTGNLGYGSVSQTISNFIMFFGTGVLGLSGLLMGLAVAIATMWDAITDPLVGYISDRTKSKFFGKRHGYILVGAVFITILNILLWSVPQNISDAAKFAWLLVSMLLLETFNTLFATPYTALGNEIASGYNDRTSVQTYKTVFFLISLIIPSILMSVFLSPAKYVTLSSSSTGYLEMAMITSLICLVCGIVTFFGTFKQIKKLKSREQFEKKPPNAKLSTIWKNFANIFKNKNYKSIILGYSISLISAAFLTSLGMHVFTYTFSFTTLQIPIVMGALVAGTLISQPVWLIVAKKTDKKPALLSGLAVLLSGIIVFAFLLIAKDSISSNYLIYFACASVFVSGFGTGALYSLPLSMFGDLLVLDYNKTKVQNMGNYSGFFTLAYKVANAIALIAIGLLLDLIGFDSSSAATSPAVQNLLGWVLVAGIAISTVCAIFIYSGYSISKSNLPKMQSFSSRKQKK